MSAQELKTAGNAIWLCADHARLVDNNRGAKFPAPLLLNYKSLHEARVSREQHNIYLPFTWLQELVVKRGPIFATPATLTLGKVTVLMGENASGKTALYEWLAGISNPAILQRWRPINGQWAELVFNVTYFTPERHLIGLKFSDPGNVQYRLDDRAVPYNPYPIRFIVLRYPHPRYSRRKVSDLRRIATILGTEVATIENLLPSVGHEPISMVRRLWLSKKSASSRLLTDVQGTCPGLGFRSLSSGEQAVVLVELAITLARFSAQYVPTVLIVDAVDLNLELSVLKKYLDFLMAPEHLFQTVVEAVDDGVQRSWTGCTMVTLIGKMKGVRIEQ